MDALPAVAGVGAGWLAQALPATASKMQNKRRFRTRTSRCVAVDAGWMPEPAGTKNCGILADPRVMICITFPERVEP
jgi:hypothetical protein